jgi:hypothetical protein
LTFTLRNANVFHADIAERMKAAFMNIGKRLEPFFDSFLIDRMEGVQLKLNFPQSAGVAIRFDNYWEGRFTGYITVLKDNDRYRMYYRGQPVVGGKKRQVTCYAESTDGVEWEKPDLGLHEVEGTRKNNVILAGDGSLSHNFSPFLDTKLDVASSERFKALTGTQETGLISFASEDGINWRQWRKEPVIPSKSNDFRYDSQNLAFWSEHENCYICFFRVWTGGTTNGLRTIARSTSCDFIHWSEPLIMDFGDKQIDHLYVNQTHPYFRAPHIYISLAARFMPGRKILSDDEGKKYDIVKGKWNDCSETVFMTSRGGNQFNWLFREGFIRPGMGRRHWVSRSNYAALGIVPTGENEMSLYIQRHYGQTSAYLERLVFRTDGFVSVNAPYTGGEMITKPIQFDGSKLVINYSTGAAGHVLIELQDETGRALDGFSLADSEMITGDEIDRVVSWKRGKDVSSLTGRSIRLRFSLKDADLYSLCFH